MGLMWLAVALAASAAIVSAAKDDFLNEMRSVVTLTADNYKDSVEGSKVGWILAFGATSDVADLGDLKDKVEGMARIGFVDTSHEDKTLLEYLDIKGDNAPKFRAKPIGKDAKFSDVETAEAAVNAVVENIPEGLVTVLPGEQAFHPFLQKTLQEGALPVLLLSDKADVPKLFVKCALWMGDPRFKYAVFPNPSEGVLKQFGAKKVPHLTLMVPQPEDDKKNGQEGQQFKFQPVPYPRKQFGGLKFKNVIRFLATVQNELEQQGYFKKQEGFDIPGKKKKDTQQEGSKGAVLKQAPLFEITADTADACAEGKLGLCVIGFLDGSTMNENKAAQLKTLEDVQKRPSNKGRALHFMWVDLTCHPKFGEYFGLTLENTPTVLAISPKKALMATLFGAYDTKKISSFVSGVLQGKRVGPMPGDKKVPVVSADENCAEIHKAMVPVEEEEDGMDDLMAEMRAEQEAADAAEAAEAASRPTAADIALEEKKKKAILEMERMNKMSNKKKKSKKKGKKKRKGKKKSKKKDEL